MGFRFLIWLLVVFSSLPLSAQAQTVAPERRTVAVSVLDKDGKAVHGLTAENFRGEFRGQPVRILSATEDSSPRRILVVVDVSASMKPNWQLAWSVAEEVAGVFDSRYAVALVSAGDNVRGHGPFANDLGARRKMLAQARAEIPQGRGSTGLFDGLIVSLWQFEPSQFGDSVCVISDGVDNDSAADATRVAELFARRGVRAFPILFGTSESKRDLRRAWRDAKRLADGSGGEFVDMRGSNHKRLPAKVALLHSSITNTYQLEIDLPQGVDKPREWTLEVTDPVGKKLKDVGLAYPRLLVPLTSK